MLDLGGTKAKTGAGNGAAAVKDATDASFMADVVEASRTQPVVVDFWAPWCGPCRQLTPVLEKVIGATRGAVRLVKVNVDENPRIAAQLRVQSIPTVYAFADGQPVDGFQGALPESQVAEFVARLTGPEGPTDLEGLLALGAELLGEHDVAGAAQAFAEALQLEPGNLKAIGGLARCYIAGKDLQRAREVLALAPAGASDPELSAARSALTLAEAAPGDARGLDRRLAEDPKDHAARFELASALAARGAFKEAADELLAILSDDLAWGEGKARQTLLTVFDAAGPQSEVARAGRRRLSSLLFA